MPSPLVRRQEAQTFGILGLGRIGTAAALRARALGYRVVFHDPHLPNGADRALGIARARTWTSCWRSPTCSPSTRR
jgi:C-terminal binding protein